MWKKKESQAGQDKMFCSSSLYRLAEVLFSRPFGVILSCVETISTLCNEMRPLSQRHIFFKSNSWIYTITECDWSIHCFQSHVQHSKDNSTYQKYNFNMLSIISFTSTHYEYEIIKFFLAKIINLVDTIKFINIYILMLYILFNNALYMYVEHTHTWSECRLGFIVDFLSHATIVGFMGGAATVVCLQQLKSILGLEHFTHAADLVSVMRSVFTQTHQVYYTNSNF